MTTTYGTAPTQYYLNAIAAQQAGGAAVNFVGGTLVVGDNSWPNSPSLSALLANNGVLSEVWRGQVITSVAVDQNNAAQLDIGVDIPATINSVEVGPFNISEFAILDASGNCCIVGTTNLQKTVSAQGQTSDLAWIAAVGVGVGSVTLMPPTGTFVTLAQVISSYNGYIPSATSPLTRTVTASSVGWEEVVFGIQPGAQPTSDPPTSATEPPALGYGRPATAGEFSAGAPTAGRFPWPWPTLQQVSAAIASLNSSLFALIGKYLPLAGGALTGNLTLAGDPSQALQAATKQYVDAAEAAAISTAEAFASSAANNAAASSRFGTANVGQWMLTPAVGAYAVGALMGITASASQIVNGTVSGVTFVAYTNTVDFGTISGTWEIVGSCVTDNSNSGARVIVWQRIA